jgi:release factor glutamine methyltransferase
MATKSNAAAWLGQARRSLVDFSDDPGLEAQILLAHGLSRPRAWVLSHPEFNLTEEQVQTFNAFLAQRLEGRPLPYVIGHWEFFGLDFKVCEDVLIPRPETELLVEQALAWSRQQDRPLRVVDVGTGSGCISASLAKNNPRAKIIATDNSRPALRVASENLQRHRLERQVALLQADLLEACRGPFDLVCANLPYIPTPLLSGLEVAHHEPRLALDGGPDGLSLVERLLFQAEDRMSLDGVLLLEIEAGQGEGAREIAHRTFPEGEVQVLSDLAGKPRLLRIDLTSA